MMNLGWVLDESTMISLALLLILPTAHAQLGAFQNSKATKFSISNCVGLFDI